jgi:hypothetical protein
MDPHTVAQLGDVAHTVADLCERVERLERLAADRTDPAVTAAAVVVEAALVALARTADLSNDR